MNPSMSMILIIEDNVPNAHLMSRLLTGMGHKIVWSTSADEGLELIDSLNPDLILMDMRLPGLKVWEATRIIKNNPEQKHISVVAVSVQNNNADQEKALDAGCDAYIVKPFAIQDFKNQVQYFLSN